MHPDKPNKPDIANFGLRVGQILEFLDRFMIQFRAR